MATLPTGNIKSDWLDGQTGEIAHHNNVAAQLNATIDYVRVDLAKGVANGVAALDAAGDVVDATGAKVVAGGGGGTYETVPAGSTFTVVKSGGTWPVRPTSRTDVVVQWKGPDPSPAIVGSGTGGMLDNVDVRLVTP